MEESVNNLLRIKSKEGYIVDIPEKYKLEVEEMIKDGCDGCLNSLIEYLVNNNEVKMQK